MRRRLTLFLAFLVAGSLHLMLFAYAPAASRIIQEMELSNAQAGVLFSASIAGLVLPRIPWGVLCDRWGSRHVIALGLGLATLSGFARASATTYHGLVVAQVGMGIGLGSIIPALPGLISGWYPGKETGRATGTYVSGFAAGNLAALSLTPVVLTHMGWRATLGGYAALTGVLCLAWWTLIRDKRRVGDTMGLEDFKGVVRMPMVWLLTGLFALAVGAYDTLSMWLPRVFELKGLGPVGVGLTSGMLSTGFLVAGPTVGTASDRMGRRRALLLLGGVSGPAILAISVAQGNVLLPLTFIAGFTTAGALTLILAIPTEAWPNQVGSATGIISSFGNTGSILFPILVGGALDLTGSYLPGLLLLAIAGETVAILSLHLKGTEQ